MGKNNREKHKCLYPECPREAINQLGLRLRRPPGPDNVWTFDTGAYLCDEHARVGMAFEIRMTLHSDSSRMYTAVSHDGGDLIEREAGITPDKKLPPKDQE